MAFQELGPAIREARTKKGMSQGSLAEALGVTQPSVSAWEAGRSLPTIPLLHKLAVVTDSDPGELLRLAASSPVAGPAPAACG